MNTRLNPTMNIREFSITVRSTLSSRVFRFSILAPEISDTYPGTSGSTHGERKDNKPATKAAIGRGVPDIDVILAIPEWSPIGLRSIDQMSGKLIRYKDL